MAWVLVIFDVSNCSGEVINVWRAISNLFCEKPRKKTVFCYAQVTMGKERIVWIYLFVFSSKEEPGFFPKGA